MKVGGGQAWSCGCKWGLGWVGGGGEGAPHGMEGEEDIDQVEGGGRVEGGGV